ncbi:hypothetical protein ASPWEDRAFT_117209 [Aspergillus wentii DTO 134E9]|uniref:FAD-binding PCMH-type domain-containing protein n=1 Tax=Aspergillus wentii DTO 134E9 TaxID=1073089 RepID=A0A1L9RAT1_ASPWE|nr:uncharacterized protein ASPWEDRAFT_117209 [Aspergillus wentii DTO 134E9]KAI9934609.1 hypothetical protein MW887_000225 [Aspergillus wentii]OJJ32032.1 hypothetical protein ASPWEDRAFT_117209 [Aspergillus wentii DTO 134E9]
MQLISPIFSFLAFAAISHAQHQCRSTPHDTAWPSTEDWKALNQSIQGVLIKASPAASSCYPGNPFNSIEKCNEVEQSWTYASYHAKLPESVDYPIWANNSCLPPGSTGYVKGNGCHIGGLPQYIVNATTEEQVATALVWATKRNIRVVVKGTGHDMNGRSSGAYALSIWTHNFNHREYQAHWPVPGSNETSKVLICGSGGNWGTAYTAANKFNRIVVGGEDASVGLGGYIQGGGHGLLSSQYGLAADQIYQATVITTQGERLIANAEQNADLFWAVRGGGPGQYGVVTEYIMKTYPPVANVVTGGLTFHPKDKSNASEKATWNALAGSVSEIPELMDSGMAGTLTAATGLTAVGFLGLKQSVPGVATTLSLTGYNLTMKRMNETVSKVAAKIAENDPNGSLAVTLQQPKVYPSYFSYISPNASSSATSGSVSLMSSRLLGRAQLSDLPQDELVSYLQRIMVSASSTSGSLLLFGFQGGPGPAKVPEDMRGALNPVWRTTYAHVLTTGASINATANPSESLATAAEWMEENKEAVWREWAPNTGAYLNEANPFDREWKKDFYGETYDRLLDIKLKYDPSESLFVLNGVGSDRWDYDLNSGRLCRLT